LAQLAGFTGSAILGEMHAFRAKVGLGQLGGFVVA